MLLSCLPPYGGIMSLLLQFPDVSTYTQTGRSLSPCSPSLWVQTLAQTSPTSFTYLALLLLPHVCFILPNKTTWRRASFSLVQKPCSKEDLQLFLRFPNRMACTLPLAPLFDTFWQCLHQILKPLLEKHPEELPQPYMFYASALFSSRYLSWQVGEIQGCGHYSQRPGYLRTASLPPICHMNYS